MAFTKTLYFAALVPPPHIKEEVRRIKLEIKERFGAAHALKLPAHITLIPPVKLAEEQEESFLKAIRRVSRVHYPFPVELENYGYFGQRVIFLNVVDHEPVKELHRELNRSVKDFLPRDSKTSLHPHVTLATRDLNPQNFKAAWQEFRNKKFRSGFIATEVTLFKHNGKSWDVLENFPFIENEK